LVENYGFSLDINFIEFAAMAHTSSSALKAYLLKTFPTLQTMAWENLYAEKQNFFLSLLTKENLEFMPGADAIIEYMRDEEKNMCVVTNSASVLTDTIRSYLPLLNEIPLWITRECYVKPKPEPDGYLAALKALDVSAEHAIGFEDSLRGARSLLAAHVDVMLVCDSSHPQMKDPLAQQLDCYETFIELLESPSGVK
jgi:HAD superfamily hydrolase (TIGR01509 family)